MQMAIKRMDVVVPSLQTARAGNAAQARVLGCMSHPVAGDVFHVDIT
jgi:hypothetical protein